MSIKKKYLTEKGVCKVTFTLPAPLAEWAASAKVVGEFNKWDPTGIPMKKSKSGIFSLSIELPVNNEYHFRYLLDGNIWETDWDADSVSAVPWSNEFNSVIMLWL